MKVFYKKQRPKIVSIEQEYCQNHSLKFGSFKKKVDNILQIHAPLKKRYVRTNQAPFIDKNINKHIMKRIRLCNRFFNTTSDIDRKAYNIKQKLCVSLIRQAKKQFLATLIQMLLPKLKLFGKL